MTAPVCRCGAIKVLRVLARDGEAWACRSCEAERRRRARQLRRSNAESISDAAFRRLLAERCRMA